MRAEAVASAGPREQTGTTDNSDWLTPIYTCIKRVIPITRYWRLRKVLFGTARRAVSLNVRIPKPVALGFFDASFFENFLNQNNVVLDTIFPVEGFNLLYQELHYLLSRILPHIKIACRVQYSANLCIIQAESQPDK